MNLAGMTRAELEHRLAGKTRAELHELIFSLVTFERLLTAREIAQASHVAKRTVLADMRAGKFVDPLHGRGFFCRSGKSLKVSASAANAWRRSFFVPVPGDCLPPHKKERAAAEIGVSAGNLAQRRNGCRPGDPGPELMRDQMLQPGDGAHPAVSTADQPGKATRDAGSMAAVASLTDGGGGDCPARREHGHSIGKHAEIYRNKGGLAA